MVLIYHLLKENGVPKRRSIESERKKKSVSETVYGRQIKLSVRFDLSDLISTVNQIERQEIEREKKKTKE